MSSAAHAVMPQFLAPEISAAQLPVPGFPLKRLTAPAPPEPFAEYVEREDYDDIYYRVVRVNSILVAELRGRSIDNQRPPKRKKVVRMARDMATYKFPVTHQALAYSRDGRVIDGNNRLMAAEMAFTMNPDLHFVRLRFAFNVPDDLFPFFDSGAARSLTDNLAIIQEKNVSPLSTALRMLVTWDRMEDRQWRSEDVSGADILDKLEHNPGIKDSLNATVDTAREIKLSQGALVAGRYIIVRAWPLASEEAEAAVAPYTRAWIAGQVDAFLHAIKTGEMLSAGQPAYELRKWAKNQADKKARRTQANIAAGPEMHLKVFLNCWNHQMTGTEIKKVFWTAKGRMPEPYVPVEIR